MKCGIAENARGPVNEHVLTYTRRKMPGAGFADMADITAYIYICSSRTCEKNRPFPSSLVPLFEIEYKTNP